MYNFTQAQIFILFIILGISIGVLFDFFRAIRKTFKTTNFITYLEDTIFMAIVGILLINALIVINNGELRFFIIIAIFFGVGFYFLTITKICFNLFYGIMKIFKKMLNFPKFIKKNRKNSRNWKEK